MYVLVIWYIIYRKQSTLSLHGTTQRKQLDEKVGEFFHRIYDPEGFVVCAECKELCGLILSPWGTNGDSSVNPDPDFGEEPGRSFITLD